MKCMECLVQEHNVALTGSFLCDSCFDKQVQRYKKYRGNSNKQSAKLEKAKKMIRDTDLSIAEIARRTDTNVNSLYIH